MKVKLDERILRLACEYARIDFDTGKPNIESVKAWYWFIKSLECGE